MEESDSEENCDRSLLRREVDELIDSIIKPPTASQKIRIKRKRGRSLVLHNPQLLQPTTAELRAENARLHAKKQELESELKSVKADFHNHSLVNQLRQPARNDRRPSNDREETRRHNT